MYFPYLRGKQYELIALREMASILGDDVVPVIEPVRDTESSGLDRCLDLLQQGGAQPPIIILNPIVGHLASPTVVDAIAAVANRPWGYRRARVGLIIDEEVEVKGLVFAYQALQLSDVEVSVIVKRLSPGQSLQPLAALDPQFVIAEDSRTLQRQIQSELKNARRVSLRDGFRPEPRNADYFPRMETTFSEEHLFFTSDGFEGFADYLTIGDGFTEGGFTPRVVAIHWTFQNDAGGPIMIRHFVSETGSDNTADIGGKFLEAAAKLVQEMSPMTPKTEAFERIRDHVVRGTYPGLGVVKKLSIQNHLELMSSVMRRR